MSRHFYVDNTDIFGGQIHFWTRRFGKKIFISAYDHISINHPEIIAKPTHL